MEVLRVDNLRVCFGGRGKVVRALDGVDIFLAKGQTTALAGESGCGKTTLARAVLGFYKPESGEIHFKGKDITLKKNEPLIRQNIQIVFQNPFLSVDPRWTVFSTLYEALTAFKKVNPVRSNPPRADAAKRASNGVKKSKAKDIIGEMLKEVELDTEALARYPHQLSGGQLQRVCIARALINKPELVILDEPTSSLDITTASNIMKLLQKIQKDLGTTFLFISHNLRLLRRISDFCFIMYYGKIIEYGPKELIFKNPLHPYTKLLMEASYYKLKYLEDKQASWEGCSFAARCPHKTGQCSQGSSWKEAEPGHFVSCRLF
ncbi:MAG: ABC transporter ATP-binding protein [Candidatus Omnitrophota bacterium]